jgi:hypothetical protein
VPVKIAISFAMVIIILSGTTERIDGGECRCNVSEGMKALKMPGTPGKSQ